MCPLAEMPKLRKSRPPLPFFLSDDRAAIGRQLAAAAAESAAATTAVSTPNERKKTRSLGRQLWNRAAGTRQFVSNQSLLLSRTFCMCV